MLKKEERNSRKTLSAYNLIQRSQGSKETPNNFSKLWDLNDQKRTFQKFYFFFFCVVFNLKSRISSKN